MTKIRELFVILRNRWKAKTPLIFKRIIKLSIGIGLTAAAIQTSIVSAGLDAPEWWMKILPYLIGAGAGASTVAKLTQQYDQDNNPIQQ